MRLWKRTKKKSGTMFVELDEIFLDSKNLENFDRLQFEGRIEKPITKSGTVLLGTFFSLAVIIFGFRLGYLQIHKGEAYFKRSENNTLRKELIFADRGIIYDRNGIKLAWNEHGDDIEEFSERTYIGPGFSHALGYVKGPAKDEKGFYWQMEFEGVDGLEKQYNQELLGKNGSRMVEIDATGKTHSENIVNAPEKGIGLSTTLDSRIQSAMFSLIASAAENNGFVGGAGMIVDLQNGEILASTSFPEYDSTVMSKGKNETLIKKYLSDKKKVFLDRAISGLYTPGSIVKPIFALAALKEHLIDPGKQILSTGSIAIPNPFLPGEETIFKDWKAHGYTDMRQALAVSSDVYFYTIGGGFEGQRGLGIANLEKYAKLFGIGEKTGIDLPDEKEGVVPGLDWKAKNFPGDPWRIGNTYHTAIGQYGFQTTLAEIVRMFAALGNSGKIITLHFAQEKNFIQNLTPDIQLSEDYWGVVREGMRGAVEYGTAAALNVPYVKVAAKTGTAELGISRSRINSWIGGFFPYQGPKYAFVVMMESGPATNSGIASLVMRGLLDWMSVYTPEYF